MRKVLHLTAILGLSVVVASAFAQDKPRRIDLPPALQKALASGRTLKYSGERVVEMREGPDRVRNKEIVLRDTNAMRIEYTSDSPARGQIIVEKNRKRMHYFPDKNEIFISPSRHDEAIMRLLGPGMMKGQRGVKFETADGDVIAGQKTTRIRMISPRGMAFQALWIEPRSGMVLKRELYNSVGGVEGYFEFTRINFNPSFRNDDFEIRVPGAKQVTPVDLALRLMKSGSWSRTFLGESSGLELEGARIVADGKALALHYRSQQGMVSMMQVKGAIESRLLERMKRAEQGFYTWNRGDRTFVLIGPMTTERLRELSLKTQDR